MKPDTRPPAAVRIDPDLYRQLAEISEKTRLSIGKLASMAIRCGLSHSSVKPVQLYSVTFEEGGRT